MSKSPIRKPLAIILGLFLIVVSINVFCTVREAKAASSITVTSPNGGETWQIGTQYSIIWTSTDVDTVTIALDKAGQYVKNLLWNIESNGSASWTPDINLTPGNNYKIRITASGTDTYDGSDAFFSIIRSETTGECLPDGTLIKLPDDPKIYVIINCQKKWIKSPEEFNQAGYKWSDVQEVSSPVIEAYAEYLEAKANLLRAIGHSRVYRIINGKRLWIPTISAFNAQGLKWTDIEQATEATVNAYPRAKLLRATGDPKVYYITESGLRRRLISAEIFASYNNQWDEIVEVSATELDAYPDSILIRVEGGIKVYKLENGQKRWIRTAQAFNRLGYDWTKIAPVNSTELNAYPTGAEIE